MFLRVLQSGRPNSSIKFFFRCLHRPASCGKMYINYICKKISKAIGLLYKTRFLVPGKSLLLLHYSEVLPAPIHAVVFPAFSCSFVPLLWLLLVPMQEDCCSWTLSLCDQSFWIIRPHSSSVCVAVNKSCDLSFNFGELLLQRPPSSSRPAT